MDRNTCIELLDKYYISIGRVTPPKFRTYTLLELRKCLILFKIKY